MIDTDIKLLEVGELLRTQKRLRRQLRETSNLQPLRIAVLGGTTTSEVVDLLELHLLASGFRPEIWQSEFNRFFEDAVLDSGQLEEFAPDIVYVHTHYPSIQQRPNTSANEAEFSGQLDAEIDRFRQIWSSVHARIGCQIIQNNFELPPYAIFSNFDSTAVGGSTNFVNQLNLAFSRASRADSRLIIHDIHSVSARLGLDNWFDWERWHSYKIWTSPEGSLALVRSLNAVIGAAFGKSKKCLVLDLDNTLWGGVIGDDGLDAIQIGTETPVAEAYTTFQHYCLALRSRGVLLAVCSKNEESIAKSGFGHPSSVLKLNHFAAFRANWRPKHENILSIADELKLGLDSFVFVDDNPAERQIVSSQLPAVTVPNVGADVALYPSLIQAGRYFELVALSSEDLLRADAYNENANRREMQSKFGDYGEYLDSLRMKAEIEDFSSVYLDRIVQLTNKTNQFNLTTRRYTFAEIESISKDQRNVCIYGKLADMFGDHGLVSIIVGTIVARDIEIDLWLMSCRVLMRDLELAMLDALVQRAKSRDIDRIVGRYVPSAKNKMVQNHYPKMGFEIMSVDAPDGSSAWVLNVADYQARNTHIEIARRNHESS